MPRRLLLAVVLVTVTGQPTPDAEAKRTARRDSAAQGQAKAKAKAKKSHAHLSRRPNLEKGRTPERVKRTQRQGAGEARGSLRSSRPNGLPGIIATVGPRSSSVESLRGMLRAGMEVTRVNLSHAGERTARQVVKNLREAARAEGVDVPPLLFDLPGGKIRLGELDRQTSLAAGDTFDLIPGGREKTTAESAAVDYPELARNVRRGDRLLLDDGRMALRVTSVAEGRVQTRVEKGGALRSGLGLALEGRDLPFPTITPADREKLEVAVRQGASWIGVSMVQGPENVAAIRTLLEQLGASHIKVVAKLESHLAMKNLDSILEVSDGLMIARGDLAVVAGSPARLATYQQQIAARARARDKPFIVASNLLSGMMDGERPTAANHADVSRTMKQKPGWLMLNETAMSDRAPRIVETLTKLTTPPAAR